MFDIKSVFATFYTWFTYYRRLTVENKGMLL